MNDDNVTSLAQLREFVKLSNSATFISKDAVKAYQWIGRTLSKFQYQRLRKKEKSLVKKYIMTMTGYSETQVDRLIARKKQTGRVVKKERTQPVFARIYGPEDVALLAEVDNAENRRTGIAVKKTCHDMYRVYKDERFENLSKISASHIYNLRGTRIYTSRSLTYEKTRPTKVDIGIRTRPRPGGIPGFLRVDSVHQGDHDGKKGVYHINLVDEVVQFEMVICVETISEEHLVPVLEAVLNCFPYFLINFHSDNGSEFINKVVAQLLQKLLVRQTKSRARHSNDNGLVEGKNNAVVRKTVGYMHIPKKYASLVNKWYIRFLNPHINFHRQCLFATDIVDTRGKIKKVYNICMTPCEKLLSLSEVEKYLKPGVTQESLHAMMMQKNHLASAQEVQREKAKLFDTIRRDMLL